MLHADSLCILHVDMTVSYIFHLTHLNSEEINKRANIIHNIIILSGSLALRDEGATYPYCRELATSHLTLSIYFHSVWLAPTISHSIKFQNWKLYFKLPSWLSSLEHKPIVHSNLSTGMEEKSLFLCSYRTRWVVCMPSSLCLSKANKRELIRVTASWTIYQFSHCKSITMLGRETVIGVC